MTHLLLCLRSITMNNNDNNNSVAVPKNNYKCLPFGKHQAVLEGFWWTPHQKLFWPQGPYVSICFVTLKVPHSHRKTKGKFWWQILKNITYHTNTVVWYKGYSEIHELIGVQLGVLSVDVAEDEPARHVCVLMCVCGSSMSLCLCCWSHAVLNVMLKCVQCLAVCLFAHCFLAVGCVWFLLLLVFAWK